MAVRSAIRPAERVVDDHRPEILRRDVGQDVQPVVPGPVEVVAAASRYVHRYCEPWPTFFAIIAGELPAAM